MKKSVAIIVLCALVAMTACTSAQTPEPVIDDVPESKHESTTLGFVLDDIADVTGNTKRYVDFVTYETERFTISRCGTAHSGAVCFAAPNEREIGVIFFLAYEGASRSSIDTKEAVNSQKCLMRYCDDHGIEYTSSEDIVGDTLVFSVWAKDSVLRQETLPLSVKNFRSPNEFFASEARRAEYLSMLNAYDYEQLYTYLSDFIGSNDISKNDRVEKLSELLPPLIELKKKCVVEVDNFDGFASLHYAGVESIGSDVCVVPSLETGLYTGISCEYLSGFTRGNWLFFNKVYVKSGDEIESISHDSNRDVLSGSLIMEYFPANHLSQLLEAAATLGAGTIRFENTKTGEVYDHALSENELAAIKTLNDIQDLHRSLFYACEAWDEI